MESVTKVLEEVKEAMCNDYCRYPMGWFKYDEENEE